MDKNDELIEPAWKRRRNERKAAGLCAKCGKRPPLEGAVHCAVCAEYQAAAVSRRRNKLQGAGLCVKCGKNPPLEGTTTYCATCKEGMKQWRAGRTESQQEYTKQRQEAWARSNPKRIKEIRDRCRAKLRNEILQHYGGVCVCCGESTPEFLTLDHINNDGKQQRRKRNGKNMTGHFYNWVRITGYPQDLQLLCYNCNIAKAHYGVCPHQCVRRAD